MRQTQMKAEQDELNHQKSLKDKKNDMDRRFARIKKKKTLEPENKIVEERNEDDYLFQERETEVDNIFH